VLAFARAPPPGAAWWHVQPRLAGLRVVALKDAVGFSAFFGVHAEAQQCFDARFGGGGGAAVVGSVPHLRDLGSSAAAGAAAGCCYHVVSYPFDRALALAHPEAHPSAVAAAVGRAGAAELYRGVLRSAAPGVLVGALTFGLYDTVLRCAGQ
jgi:hypothetical protein